MKILKCPVCKSDLYKNGNSYVCKNKHSFDVSKEGYANLLMNDAKHSKDPGDNKLMAQARRDFLQKDFYLPLANKISDLINEFEQSDVAILDAGAGVGYYLNKITNQRIENGFSDEFYAVDISKHAVKICSKSNKEANCFVASVFDLPFESNSFDVIYCVFSPYAMDEYKRVLKDNGILITVSPAENHLIEIRELLYQKNVRQVETKPHTQGFQVKTSEKLSYNFNLKNSYDISALLSMTPYFYTTSQEKIQEVINMNSLSTTANFSIFVLEK